MKIGNFRITKKIIVRSVVALFLLITFFDSFVVISSGNVGVVTQLGKVNREAQPGLSFKIPFFESVQSMDVQVQKEQIDATAGTNDLQNVTATVALNYHLDHSRVSDIFVNLSSDYTGRIIDPSLQESIKAVTAQYNASELLTKRSEVATKTQALIQSKLQPRGILIDQFSVVNFKFSDQYSQAIEAKQVAQQDAEKAQYNLQQAELNAKANAAQQAALTPEILEQQAIAKWDGHLPTYLGQGSVFNIPLNK
jgi:regulator of protease activity HflC (stomatin/prohibitin superfamily)